MEMSESIQNLATALAAAQFEIKPADLDAINPFLKNKYASLGSVIEAARPVLKAHGLSVSQFAEGSDGYVSVTTVLAHESGEWMRSTISLPLVDEKGKSGAQVAGSIITYLRRYALAAVLGMYADEDTDGNAPQATPQRRQRVAASKQVETPAQDAPAPYNGAQGAPHWTETQNWAVFWAYVKGDLRLTEDEAHAALHVESVRDFKGTKTEAMNELKEYALQKHTEALAAENAALNEADVDERTARELDARGRGLA
jgi:hypothetical protein